MASALILPKMSNFSLIMTKCQTKQEALSGLFYPHPWDARG